MCQNVLDPQHRWSYLNYFCCLPRYWTRDRVALLSVSLAVGLLGGRLLVRPAPRLQPAYMLSTVCGSYSGIGGIAQCRIEVPRIRRDTEILVRWSRSFVQYRYRYLAYLNS